MAGNITLDFDPIRDAIWDWINKSINKSGFNNATYEITTYAENSTNAIPIRRAESNSVRPSGGFVEYKFLTGLLKIGLADELLWDSNTLKWKLRGIREFTISVTAFGDKSREVIALIQQGLSSPFIISTLRSVGLAVKEENTVSDATAFLEEDHEERSVLDVRFGLCLENTDIVSDLSAIESVELKNKIVDPNAAGPYTVTISEP